MVATRRGVRGSSPSKSDSEHTAAAQATPFSGRRTRSTANALKSPAQTIVEEASSQLEKLAHLSTVQNSARKRCTRALRLHSPDKPCTPAGSVHEGEISDVESCCSAMSDIVAPVTRKSTRRQTPAVKKEEDVSEVDSCSSVASSAKVWRSTRKKRTPDALDSDSEVKDDKMGSEGRTPAVSRRVRALRAAHKPVIEDSEMSDADSIADEVPKSATHRSTRAGRKLDVPLNLDEKLEISQSPAPTTRRTRATKAKSESVSEPMSCDSEGFESGPSYSRAMRKCRKSTSKVMDSDSDHTDVGRAETPSSSRTGSDSSTQQAPALMMLPKSLCVVLEKTIIPPDGEDSSLESTVMEKAGECTLVEEEESSKQMDEIPEEKSPAEESGNTAHAESLPTSEEPAELIEAHREPAGIVEDHREPAEMVEDHREPAEIAEDHREPAEIAEDHPEPAGIVEDYREPAEIAEDHREPAEIAEDHPEPAEIAEDDPEPAEIAEDHPEPAEIAEDDPEPAEIAEDDPEPAEIAEDHHEPAKIAEDDPEPAEIAEDHHEPAKIAEDDPEPAEIAEDHPEAAEIIENHHEPREMAEDAHEPAVIVEDQKEELPAESMDDKASELEMMQETVEPAEPLESASVTTTCESENTGVKDEAVEEANADSLDENTQEDGNDDVEMSEVDTPGLSSVDRVVQDVIQAVKEAVVQMEEREEPTQSTSSLQFSEQPHEGAIVQYKSGISLLDISEDEEEDDDDFADENGGSSGNEEEDLEANEKLIQSGKTEVTKAVDGLFMIDTRPGQEADEQYYKDKLRVEEQAAQEAAEEEEDEEFMDEEAHEDDDDAADVLFSSRSAQAKALSSRIDPGISMKELGGLYISFDGSKSKPVSGSQQKPKQKKILDEVMKKSVICPDFEKKDTVPPYKESKEALKLKHRAERAKTTGDSWFNMKAPEITPELKGDLQLLRMRGSMDPKRFYKKNDRDGFPKYFQMGTVVDSPVDFYHSRIPKKNRKRTMVEELLADAEFRQKNKKKFQAIMVERAAQAGGNRRHKMKNKFHKK